MINYRSRECCAAIKRLDILSLTNFRVAFVIAVVASFFTAVLITVDQFFVVDTDLRHWDIPHVSFSCCLLFFCQTPTHHLQPRSPSNLTLPTSSPHSQFARVRYLGIESGPYSLFTSVLALLLAFRTSQAHDRFEEGISTAYEVTGGLYMAASNLFAFAQYGSASKKDVQGFQQTVARLMSLLSALMLSQLEGRDSLNVENGYEMMDVASLSMKKVRSLSKEEAKTEVAVQWIKTLIVDSMATGTLSIPPPILTRVFHELDISMGRHHTAAKFSQVPFPFPYAATMDMIMVFHTILTPIVMMNLLPSSVYLPIPAVGLILFFLWSQHLVAGELENPYDGGRNDMDLHVLQGELNEKLKAICRVEIGDVPDLLVEIDAAVSLLSKSRPSRARQFRTAGRSKFLTASTDTTSTIESRPSRKHLSFGNLSFSNLVGRMLSSTESVRPRHRFEATSTRLSTRTELEQTSACREAHEERDKRNTDELASEDASAAGTGCVPEATVVELADDVRMSVLDVRPVPSQRWWSFCGLFDRDLSDDNGDGHMLC